MFVLFFELSPLRWCSHRTYSASDCSYSCLSFPEKDSWSVMRIYRLQRAISIATFLSYVKSIFSGSKLWYQYGISGNKRGWEKVASEQKILVSGAPFGIEMLLLRKGVSQRWLSLSGIQVAALSLGTFTREAFIHDLPVVFSPGIYLFQGNVGLTSHSQNLVCKEMGLLKELGVRPWTAFGIACGRLALHLLCHSHVNLKESRYPPFVPSWAGASSSARTSAIPKC